MARTFIFPSKLPGEQGALPVALGGMGSVDPKEGAENLTLVTYDQVSQPNGIFLLTANRRLNKSDLPPELSDPSVPALYGPLEVDTGATITLKITNYDAYTVYTASATGGTVLLDGEDVRFTAGSVNGQGSLTINGRTYQITIKVPIPATPVILAPENHSSLLNVETVVLSSTFALSGGVDTHLSTDWELAWDAEFVSIARASYADNTNLTSWSLTEMEELTDYYVRCRYHGTQAGVSAWSSPLHFTTGNNGRIDVEVNKLVAFDAQANDRFGYATCLYENGQRLAVGAIGNSNLAVQDGAIYLYHRDGDTWIFDQKILSPVVEDNHHFGYVISVTDDGTVMLASATGANTRGIVHYFRKVSGAWTHISSFEAPAEDLSGGIGVAISVVRTGPTENGDCLAVVSGTYQNAQTGAVYTLTLSNDTWTFRNKLVGPRAKSHFGGGVCLSGDGNLLVVTESYYPTGSDSGNLPQVNTYARSGYAWIDQNWKIQHPTAEVYFGRFASMNAAGTLLAFGIITPNQSPANSGQIDFYTRTTGNWTYSHTIQPASLPTGGVVGVSIASSALLGVMGRDGEDGVQLDTGAVYTFR